MYHDHPILCQVYAFLFYWSFLSLLFLQVALAVNRWTVVCTDKFRWIDVSLPRAAADM